MLHKRAKLIYYLNSIGRKYTEDELYTKHIQDMLDVLDAFGIYSTDSECCVWLYAMNYPKDKIVKDFGDRIADVVSSTSGNYRAIKNNPNSANLVLIDRVAHVNYFIENAKKSYFEAFQKHHQLFRRELFSREQNPKIWAYLDSLMEKSWESLVCI